ncbi:threonine--tRNA ligase [Candidatus Karelsulcia muelleri]|uniref:threonine--tRNA ligase n=1 Tax=Candidatus Karelsulcia muelleri TaxID=336810 RepID=UPI0035C88D1C
MINITFNKVVFKYDPPITPLKIKSDIIETKLYKKIISVSINGEQKELDTNIYNDCEIVFYTWEHEMGKKAFWHSSSHLLAQSILDFYPKAKLNIGPAINNGFYYDIDFGKNFFSEKDFYKIEINMLFNASKCFNYELYYMSKSEAKKYYKNNIYKLYILNNIKKNYVTICKNDNFIDLCRGCHIPNTSFIKAVKILNISGVYWKGDKNNKQLTRIYAISSPYKKYLYKYFLKKKESKKRDHRKIGKKLELFTFSNIVGQGLPIWLPKGFLLKKKIENFLLNLNKKIGYEMVTTPHIANKKLYNISGHLEKYYENSFNTFISPNKEEQFLLKSMNCPHHCEIYNYKKFSYKDLPKRFAEFGTVYRYEKSGELHGLTRVRSFTQDDAHIFCTKEQLIEELKSVIDMIIFIFKKLGFYKYKAQISLRDNKKKYKYIGSKEHWNKSEKYLIKATKEKKIDTYIKYGEAAFYGPKLDFMVQDILGRNWQLGTVQVDYNLPERFNLFYTNNKNKLIRPIMIHRATLGSLERFIAILIENTEGNFPLWLSPIPIIIIPILEKNFFYSKKILNLLMQLEIQSFIDSRIESLSKKIIDAEIDKIPLILVLGDKEEKLNSVSIRSSKEKKIIFLSLERFLNFLKKEINLKL